MIKNITLVISSYEAYEISAALPIQISYCKAVKGRAVSPI